MNIITVGREFGSGGREIGKRLAEELGFAYYDHEIISEIAARTSLSEDYVQSIVEHRPYFSYPIHTARTLYVQSDPVLDQNIDIYSKQHSLIKELAEKSDCVIVGRCADYILRDQHPIRLFVYADDATKIKRCREKEAANGETKADKAEISRSLSGTSDKPLTDKEWKKCFSRVNKERAKYYEFYTSQKWGSRENYDLLVNTSGVTPKMLVPGIASLIKSMKEL